MSFSYTTVASHVVRVAWDGELRVVFAIDREAAQDAPFALPAPPIPPGYTQAGSILAYLPAGSNGVGPPAWVPLGPGGTPVGDLFKIPVHFQLNPLYTDAMREEVRQFERNTGIEDPELRDMTELPFITIDNDDSRDLDQAMFIERSQSVTDGAQYVVYYALADASYYVKPESAMFRRALARGTSYYLPKFTVPMLPPALSEGLVSLNPNVPRRSLCMIMHIDSAGVCLKTSIVRSRMKSAAKLSYRGVQRYYDGDPTLKGKPYTETLDLLKEVGLILITEGEARDIVRYERTSLDVNLDFPSNVDPTKDLASAYAHLGLHKEVRVDTDRYNEQISLLCNREGAKFFSKDAEKYTQVQPIYRKHSPPPQERLASVNKFISTLVRVHGLDAGVWTWQYKLGETVQAYLTRLPMGDQRVERIKDSIERQFLLANTSSEYSKDPGPHYALGVAAYSRFSSPMREVVGIFTHKEALEKLYPALAAPYPASSDEALRERVIKAGMESRQTQNRIEKAVQELAMDFFFAEELVDGDKEKEWSRRTKRAGTVMGMAGTKVYITLDDPPLELKVYLDDVGRASGERWAVVERFHAEDGVVARKTGEQWKESEVKKNNDATAKRGPEGQISGKSANLPPSPSTGRSGAEASPPSDRPRSRSPLPKNPPTQKSGLPRSSDTSWVRKTLPVLVESSSSSVVPREDLHAGPIRVGDRVVVVTAGYRKEIEREGGMGGGRWIHVFVKDGGA